MIKDTQKKNSRKPWYHGKAGVVGFLMFFLPLIKVTFTYVSLANQLIYWFVSGVGFCILAIYMLLHLNEFFD